MKKWFETFGERLISFFRYIGEMTSLFVQTLFWMVLPPFRMRQIAAQMNRIGVSSLPIVSLISIFTGMALVFQTAYQMQRISAEFYIPSLVALSMTRELGPVLTALVVAGRVGASITAALGTMKVTEQIDALETLATNPVKYLVVPRFVSLVTMLPLLTLYGTFIGILGGYIIGVTRLGLGSALYIEMTTGPLDLKDVLIGLLKSVFFAIIICIVACHEGLSTRGGAEGVGTATTRSVVVSFILVIAADCVFTALFYFIL